MARLAYGTAACERCETAWQAQDVVFVPNGERRPIIWDGRRRTPTGGRFGASPEWHRTTIAAGERLCPRCRGLVPTSEGERLARGMWTSAVPEPATETRVRVGVLQYGGTDNRPRLRKKGA